MAEASAQTAPATAAKTKVKSVKATARAEKKARRVAIKSAPAMASVNDGWPPLEDSQAAVATTTTTNAAATDWGYGEAAAPSRGELDNANVYAAPGMPVHIRTSKVAVPYSVRPPRKTASAQTTLGN
ncbi:hypothetical protein ACFQT0_06255 [Hymenobacter humi]|uniref:Uncharacterized protein n=1 Tax=Hymenobacter humi TaxID=1411620 RepID=A0ABW2U154_9BACT